MAQTISDVAPDPILTGVAMQYGTGGGYAHDQLVPFRTVGRSSFKYKIWNLRDMVQGGQYDSRRAPGAASTRVQLPGGSWVTGNVHERSFDVPLPDEIRLNDVIGAYSADLQNAAQIRMMTRMLRVEIEIEVRDLITDITAVSYTTPTVKWDATSGTIDILGDIDTAKEAFVLQCGFDPTHILIPPTVRNAMIQDSSILDLIKYNPNQMLTQGQLPAQLRGMQTVVPGAIVDTANPGASASIARVWSSDKVVLAYVDMAAASDPNAMTSVCGFRSETDAGTPWAAWSQRDPIQSAKQDLFHVETFDEIKLVAGCVYILNDVLT